ncbi:MAG: bifunctional diguanylate cyclase/phosphodiesterase [Eubacteriales bacterium]
MGMADYNYWNPYFADNEYPCYIRDIYTEEIIYANEKFFYAFQCDESIIGKKYYEIVDLDQDSIDHINNSIQRKKDYDFKFTDKKTNLQCLGNAHLIRDQRSIFCQCRVMLEENTKLEVALTRCTEIYKLPHEEVAPALMKLLLDYYGGSRAYLHRINKDDLKITCIAECTKGRHPRVNENVFTGEEARKMIAFAEKNLEDNISKGASAEMTETDPALGESLIAQGINNYIFSTVEDINKNIVGVVGITNLENFEKSVDTRLLETVSRFVAQDITQGLMDEKLVELYHRDSLTGLYNRTGYVKRVDRILEESPKSLGIISANINGLKYVNEKLGIEGGDEYVKKCAKRIKEHFQFVIFRMSGDEFLGIAPNVEKEEFESTVFTLIETMKDEENYDFSIGHSWAKGKIDLTQLTFEAETLMYINKQEYYAKSERKFDSVNDSVLSDLLSFLENDEFMIYLQPQVRLKDASLHGAEALIRRFDKTNQKMVFPDQFISLYEKNSVIRHVDMFVVEEVCKLLQKWNSQGKAIPISVNLSRVTLQEYGIVESIVEICDKYSVPHQLLVIEVTERVGLIENNVASSLIVDFKKHGFAISLDDFGCAYSNIVTLAQIDVNEVKIDKSLVDNVLINHKNKVIVESLLTMCNKLEDTTTLAEGIEDKEQADLLQEMACTLGQGYYYSRPIPVPEFSEKYI